MFWLIMQWVGLYLEIGVLFALVFFIATNPNFTFNGKLLKDYELFAYSTLLWPIALVLIIIARPE